MSKSKAATTQIQQQKIVSFYTLTMRNGGYVPVKMEYDINNQKIISVSDIYTEDILVLSLAKLEKAIKTDLGL